MKLPKESSYPKKVFITNETYRIIFDKRCQYFGETDPEKKTIRIRSGMSKREIFATFVHELLHAFAFEHSFKLKHDKVYALEKAFVEFFLDNFLE